jgi:alkylation response protein AidB-like acyl-CoA dehydrogenase
VSVVPRIAELPAPFLEPRHRELAQEARAKLAGPLADVDARFARGELDESAAARAAVAALAGTRVLHEAVLGEARSLCVARSEVAAISGFADTLLALQGLGSFPIRLAGNAEQKARWLEAAAFGTRIAAFALTEPEAGSDARSMTTTARRDGLDYVLDGEKTLITNAGIADFHVVFARLADEGDDGGASGAKSEKARHVALVVEKEAPGLSVPERFELLAPHPIGRLRFEGCRVPARQRLGEEGQGLALAFATLDRFRASVGAAATGLAARALAEARVHLKRRRQFGRALADFQLLKAQLADCFVELELARLAVQRAAWLVDREKDATAGAASSLAKLVATEAASRIADRCVQFFGGQGVVVGNVVERIHREVRALRIYEGTSEIQRLILARELLQGALAGEGDAGAS